MGEETAAVVDAASGGEDEEEGLEKMIDKIAKIGGVCAARAKLKPDANSCTMTSFRSTCETTRR